MKQSVAEFDSNRSELENGPKDLGPFAKSAENLWRVDLTPIPVGGEDGKKPLVTSFTKWKRRPGLITIRRWIEKYPDDNAGIVTGRLSGISIVDIDSADPTIQRAMIERFGDTPLKTRTPSGGYHLWYRYNDEASADLSPDIPVQIKASGGIVVVPPSVRPSGTHAGRRYEFIEGSLNDLVRLPIIKPGSTERVVVPTTNPTRLRAVGEGWRNNSLFRHLKDNAPHCDDYETLLDVGRTFGQHDCDPPLLLAEIIKTVDSVWKMMKERRLWAKGAEPRVIVSGTVIDALSGDALKLLLKLQLSHFGHDHFALSAKAMAEVQVIPGWSHHKYRAARTEILNKGYLKMVHGGGSRPGDPSLFGFASPPVAMGTKSVPNITIHPPPGRFPAKCPSQNETCNSN
ncbi:MAG: bifunctional DNA primase/polymerase [Alphaproteobacteria bacterium]|nr:bifunctional DNA primase/polymerase [Alphaproteobacteria bacterium]